MISATRRIDLPVQKQDGIVDVDELIAQCRNHVSRGGRKIGHRSVFYRLRKISEMTCSGSDRFSELSEQTTNGIGELRALPNQ